MGGELWDRDKCSRGTPDTSMSSIHASPAPPTTSNSPVSTALTTLPSVTNPPRRILTDDQYCVLIITLWSERIYIYSLQQSSTVAGSDDTISNPSTYIMQQLSAMRTRIMVLFQSRSKNDVPVVVLTVCSLSIDWVRVFVSSIRLV